MKKDIIRIKIKKHKGKLYTLLIVFVMILIGSIGLLSKPTYENPKDIERPFLGQENSSIVIVKYLDLQCPACKAAHPIINKVIEDFGEDIRYEVRHLPLTSIHPQAKKAAEGAECALDQGKFFEYIDIVFENQNEIYVKNLKGYAIDLGLDIEKFSNCLDSFAKTEIVNKHIEEAVIKGYRSTPTFEVNGEVLRDWSYLSFEEKINSIKNQNE